ncbi:MAG: DnaD domain protein [Oscillospiraceae bacterium]|nr:DnaD domain protein [Oscillospiraceae bacterium]
MLFEGYSMDSLTIQKLLSAASGDGALLYIYLKSGNDPVNAQKDLLMTETRYQCAAATLRQMGLWPEAQSKIIPMGERPQYTEQDVMQALNKDREFRSLYGEIQRLLGKTLNNEELKIILGFVRYLGLPADVICVLVCYCKDRAKQKGGLRNPSLRTIEKEAYAWAEQGIDTIEQAGAFIQAQNLRRSRLQELMRILQIRNRELTPGEKNYAQKWLEMGLHNDVIGLAYERTCINTGAMNWPYMNKILTRWHEKGFRTAQQVLSGDKKPVPKGASGELGQAELEAIQKALQEV